MTPATQAILLFRGALAIGALLAGWFLWGQFTDWIKADERAAREKAEQSAADWKLAAENEAKAKAWLNQVLVDRAKREAARDRKQEDRDRALDNLKNPDARTQRDQRLHPDLVRESAYAGKAGDSGLQGAQVGPAAGGKADRPGVQPGLPDSRGRAETQEPGADGAGQGQRPDSGRSQPLPLMERLKAKWKELIP